MKSKKALHLKVVVLILEISDNLKI